jgi:hypothetical protein
LNLTNTDTQLLNTINKVLEGTEVKSITGMCMADGSIIFKTTNSLGKNSWFILNQDGLDRVLILNYDVEVISLI